MQITITITPQWQIYLPQKVRELLQLTKPGKANVEVKEGKIMITPVRSAFLQRSGMLKNASKKKDISVENIRDYIDYTDL